MIVRDAARMIAHMAPELIEGEVTFVTTPDVVEPSDTMMSLLASARGMFHEAEGTTLIVPTGDDTPEHLRLRQITLRVHSALDGVGLTAAVSTALAKAGIACNVVAAHHHDHLFVPATRAEEALKILKGLAAKTEAALS